MFFDTHAHYDDEQFDSDRAALLDSMQEAGVGRIVNPGCTVDSSRAAVGIHPEECAGAAEEAFAAIEALAAERKVVAIGEIGLDYYWEENPPREEQKEVFARQLALAEKLDLPVIVHDREAHGDCLDLVRAFPGVRGVFHCYSGSVEDARALLETDAPYLAPVPLRGKRNDSRNLPYVAARVAALKGLSPEAVEQAAWDNGCRFFGLDG